MVKKAKPYKTMPIKKIGDQYWRHWSSFGRKGDADREKDLVKRRGYRCRVTEEGSRSRLTEVGSRYRVWYLPGEQGVAKRDYARYRQGR